MRWKKNKSQENNYENNNYIKVSVVKKYSAIVIALLIKLLKCDDSLDIIL